MPSPLRLSPTRATRKSRGHSARAFDLRGQAERSSAISALEAARRIGVSLDEFFSIARSAMLEPTYSIDEVAGYFGTSKGVITKLVRYGLQYGARLHPTRGGLWPTFKPTHKSRRIPLSAIERHKARMDKEAAA